MKITSVKYLVGEGFKNAWVNRLMSIASVGVLMACMILMGIALIFSENINVAFAMHVVGSSGKNVRREVSKALAKVGLGNKARSMPSQLSGGEQQRVGLARALVNSPDIIIADEPTGNVDPNMSYEIVSMLTEINKQGTTILMVTHDHNLVRDFQHRVIMLDSGKIVADNAGGTLQ